MSDTIRGHRLTNAESILLNDYIPPYTEEELSKILAPLLNIPEKEKENE